MATVVRTTAVSTVTVNAAFLQEIKDVHEELWQLLANVRELCSSSWMVRQHTGQFTDMLIDLRDQLALHFALEEAYGYFEDPVYAPPFVAEKAEQLRAQHRHLYLLASELAEAAEQWQFDGNLAAIVNGLPSQFAQLDSELLTHEACEIELIQSQFVELGTGD
jgi:hypothetical protein